MAKVNEPIELKIKKILELANKAVTEEERSLAMGRVQEMLAKYNLDMAQVNQAADAHTKTEADGNRVKEAHTRGAMYTYQQNLWATIATCNFCWHWTIPVYKTVNGVSRKVTRHHYIIGREVNVLATKLMGDYLEETINRTCPFKGKDCLSRSAISWKEGCAERLRSRLYTRYSEMEAASTAGATNTVDANGNGCTALTLRSVREAEYDSNYLFAYGEKSFNDMVERRRARKAAAVVEHIVNGEAEKPETNAQRVKRQARERRESERYDRKQRKYWDNKDLNAWYKGREQGAEIGLDPQVGQRKQEVIA